MGTPVKKIKNEKKTKVHLQGDAWPVKFPEKKFFEKMEWAPWSIIGRNGSKQMSPQKEEAPSLFSKSFHSVNSKSLRWAFRCIGIGFLSLISLPFLNPHLALVAIGIMFGGAVTGLVSSFTTTGRTLNFIRKASRHFSENNPEKALEYLQKACALKPTNGIKEDINQLKLLLIKKL